MKSGDKIYWMVGDCITFCEVYKVASNHTLLLVNGKMIKTVKCRNGLFYGFNYSNGVRYLFLRKFWHFYPACVFEFVRDLLPDKVNNLLKLER